MPPLSPPPPSPYNNTLPPPPSPLEPLRPGRRSRAARAGGRRKALEIGVGRIIVAEFTSGCACTASASHSERSMTNSTAQRVVVDQRQQADRARLDAEVLAACARRDAKPRRPDPIVCAQRIQIDGDVVRARSPGNDARPFLSRRKRFLVFAPGSGGTSRMDSSTVITGGMLVSRRHDAVFLQELAEVHP